MKYRILLCIFCCLHYYQSFSYSDSTITAKELKGLVGCWKGSITYLDYSTNKPFSMPANMIVGDFKNNNNIAYSLIYPKEPAANSLDTIVISEHGKLFNNEVVRSKRWISKDSLVIITEISGKDGNDNKAAIIRHTYMLGQDSYSFKKEVQFVGQTLWILRNEYKFLRMKPCS